MVIKNDYQHKIYFLLHSSHIMEVETTTTTAATETMNDVPVKTESNAASEPPAPTKRRRRNMFDVKPEGQFFT